MTPPATQIERLLNRWRVWTVVGITCSLIAFFNMFLCPRECFGWYAVFLAMITALVTSVALPVTAIVALHRSRQLPFDQRLPVRNRALRLLGASAICTGLVVLTISTDLEEQAFLWWHLDHYRAVLEGSAQDIPDGEVRRCAGETVFMHGLMLGEYFMVFDHLADAESGGERYPLLGLVERESVSFWRAPLTRELAHHLGWALVFHVLPPARWPMTHSDRELRSGVRIG